MKETVTLHTMTALDRGQCTYARVLRKYGRTSVGQSLMLHRLTPNQLRIASEAASKDHISLTALGEQNITEI